MSEFKTIEIDFDVYKAIEAERRSFSERPNDALRRLLGLKGHSSAPEKQKAVAGKGHPWVGDGITLPHGTPCRMRYNNRRYEGVIQNGKWLVDGQAFDSPSGAASGIAVTKNGKHTRLDGWIYWEVMLAGDRAWTPIKALRRSSGDDDLTLEDLGL